MRDLAPNIIRQRLIIEGIPSHDISEQEISDYLTSLSTELEMTTLLSPVTHQSEKYGWAGWIHWETSGAHFYSWINPRLFFSVDIYTCKPFAISKAVDFTREYFGAQEIEYEEF